MRILWISTIVLALLGLAISARAQAPPVNIGGYLYMVSGCATYLPPGAPPVKGALCVDTVNNQLYVSNGVVFLPGTNAEHSTTVSGALTYALQSSLVTNEVFTFAASATVT